MRYWYTRRLDLSLSGSRNERTDRLVLEVESSAENVDETLHWLPPLFLSSSVLEVGSFEHLRQRNESNTGTLDRDRSGTRLAV